MAIRFLVEMGLRLPMVSTHEITQFQVKYRSWSQGEFIDLYFGFENFEAISQASCKVRSSPLNIRAWNSMVDSSKRSFVSNGNVFTDR